MLVQKFGHVHRTDVFSTFQKPTGENWYGICMRLYQICHDFCELDLIFQCVYLPLLIREQGGEGMDVVVVDAGDVRIRDDDEGEVAEGLDPVSEADGQEGEGEVRGGEEG